MAACKTVLFDLDGTLTDPGEGITKSVQYALKKFGVEVADRTALYPFIGPPLDASFQKYYGFSPEKAQKAIEYYREYFKPTGIFENVVYDGVPEMLDSLKNAGLALAIATSKPEPFAVQIAEHFGLSKYFCHIVGSNLDGTRVKKAEVIHHALRLMQVHDLETAVMVGDREHDIIGAKSEGLRSIGVLYGYGSREELESAGASGIAETVADVGRLIRKHA